jgi:hypothetical protein
MGVIVAPLISLIFCALLIFGTPPSRISCHYVSSNASGLSNYVLILIKVCALLKNVIVVELSANIIIRS